MKEIEWKWWVISQRGSIVHFGRLEYGRDIAYTAAYYSGSGWAKRSPFKLNNVTCLVII